MIWIIQHFADKYSIKSDTFFAARINDRWICIGALKEQMLVELVDEVTLNRFEGLVHAIEHQIVPVWRQTHEFAKAIWVVLYQGKGDKSI